ncbi:hypothetical protein J1N35_043304, partial [Gossypium stocksii]
FRISSLLRAAISFHSVTFSHNLSNITDLSSLPDHILIELFLRTLRARKLTERVLKLFIATGKDEAFSLIQVVNIQVTVTHFLPTTGWEGSAHDSRILSDALSRPRGLRISEGKYYLTDAGYGIRNGYITPYHGVRYHLK